MKSLKATRLGAADIEEFEAVVDLNDDDDDDDDEVGDTAEASEFDINDDTEEATIVDCMTSLKAIAKVLTPLIT